MSGWAAARSHVVMRVVQGPSRSSLLLGAEAARSNGACEHAADRGQQHDQRSKHDLEPAFVELFGKSYRNA
jgi:hypothetical protein